MDTDLDTLLAKLAATPRRQAPVEAFTGTKRYEIKRRLGGGAFGDVYEARDREHGNLIALKALKSSQPEWIYRFKREFRMVGDLSHPNVARVFQLFCEEDRWYLTMELVDGVPFDVHLERSPQDMRPAFAQLAQALAALHGAGCLHRDVKPSNALVESTGRVVLLDFGLAVERTDRLRTAIAGTPPFMAPELAMGDQPSEASDWYSFGVMLYHALAGELPYVGSRSEVFSRKLSGEVRPPSTLREGIDPELEALALALLAPTSSKRPSVDEILTALEGEGRRRAPADKSEMVGRDRELQLLEVALESVRASIPVVATVRGEPGMGKTTLVQAFAERCRETGVQVYLGRCHETEVVPYKGLDGAIDMLCGDLARRRFDDVVAITPRDIDALAQMFPVLKRVPAFARARDDARMRSPNDARRVASRALRELLLRMTSAGPLALILDDMHWCNSDAVQVLADLFASPAPPMLTLIAYRDVEPGQAPALESLLAAIGASDAVERVDIEVRPFDELGVARILAEQQQVPVDVAQAMEETGGHPYLLSRLVRGQAVSSSPGIDLVGLLHNEVEALPPAARAVLEAVSLSVVPLSERAAFEAAGASVDAAVLDLLRRNKMVQRVSSADDGPIEAYHDRVRESAVAAMSPERRREVHARLAELLEGRGSIDPEALAYHYREGGDRVRALDCTLRAARNAARALAFARAVELLSNAAELADDDPTLLDVLEELAEAQVYTARRGDAGETLLRAAEVAGRLGDSARRTILRGRAGEHFLVLGDHERGFVLAGEVLDEVGMQLPPTATLAVAHSINLGGALATRGLDYEPCDPDAVDPVALMRMDLALGVASAVSLVDIRAPWIASRVLLDALDTGDPTRIQRALVFFALNNSGRAPDHPFVVEALERSRELAERLGDEQGLAWSLFSDGMFHFQRLDLIDAIDAWRTAERLFLASRVNAREAALARIGTALVCGNFGVDVLWARTVTPDITVEAEARGDAYAANWSRIVHFWMSLASDLPDVAAGHMRSMERAWPNKTDSMFGIVTLINGAALDLYRDGASAWDAIERITPTYRASFSSLIPMPQHQYNRTAASAALACLGAGRCDRDTAVARLEACKAGVENLVHHTATHHAVTAMLRGAKGDRAGYIAELELARQAYRRNHQASFALAAEYRLHQARGDEQRAREIADQMRAITIGDPDAYSRALVAAPMPAG